MHVKYLVHQMLSLVKDPLYHSSGFITSQRVFHLHSSLEKVLLLKLTRPWDIGVSGHFCASRQMCELWVL